MSKSLIALVFLATAGALTACACAQGSLSIGASKPATSIALANAPLTKAQEDELLGFLKEVGSDRCDTLAAMRQNDPGAYRSQIGNLYVWMSGIKQFPPQYWRAYVQQQEGLLRALRLVAKLRQADQSQKAAVTAELRKEISDLYDARMLVREHRLSQLGEQLAMQEIDQDKYRKDRDTYIKDSLRSWLLSGQTAGGGTAVTPGPSGVKHIATTTSTTGPRPAVAPNGITQAQEDETLDFFKKMGSDKYDQLVALRNTNPATYQTMIRSWYYWVASVKRYPEKYWKAYVIQQEAYTVAARLVADLQKVTDDSQRTAMMADLKKQVAALFDAQMLIRENRLTQLREQLAALQNVLERDKASREQGISDNLQSWILMAAPAAKSPPVDSTTAPATSPAIAPSTGPADSK